MASVPGLSVPGPFTVKIVPVRAFSGFPPSAGGLKLGSRQVPVQVGGSAGSIFAAVGYSAVQVAIQPAAPRSAGGSAGPGQALLAANEPVGAYPFPGFWLDIGRHEDYEVAVEMWEEQVKALEDHPDGAHSEVAHLPGAASTK